MEELSREREQQVQKPRGLQGTGRRRLPGRLEWRDRRRHVRGNEVRDHGGHRGSLQGLWLLLCQKLALEGLEKRQDLLSCRFSIIINLATGLEGRVEVGGQLGGYSANVRKRCWGTKLEMVGRGQVLEHF